MFTKDLKYVREIGSPGNGPGQICANWDVSSDEHGDVYINDKLKRCVHVYSNGGEFIRTICADKLGCPHGVAVSAGQENTKQ